jgi:outer membrane receptor protein involved in Fe transport
LTLYQFSNDLAWTKGRHALKIGGDFRFYINPKTGGQSQYGYYQFTSLANFLIANPSTVTFSLPGSILSRRWRQSMTSFYLQDDIKLARRLTMNIGVRYERESVPTEDKGLSAVIRNPITAATGTIGPPFINPTNLGFAPRIGLAWDPFGDGKTSIRAGWGLFYSPLWNDSYS